MARKNDDKENRDDNQNMEENEWESQVTADDKMR